MNPTLIGLTAVIIWGASVPIIKLFQEQLGLFAYTAITFCVGGLLGICHQAIFRKGKIDRAIFRQPMLYAQWTSFIVHEGLLAVAVWLVVRDNLPVVVLLNYFWPTAVIFCSIAIAGVEITRLWAIILGSIVVLSSLSMELLGHQASVLNLQSSSADHLGYLLAFIGAISWGVYSALSRRYGTITGDGRMVPFFQLSLGLIALPAALYFQTVNAWHPSGATLALLSIYCLFQFIGYFCWDFGMRNGNVIYLSLGADFIPWISLIVTAFLVGVTIPVITIYAAVALVIGAMVTRYGTLPK